ncbi:endonuclease III domain-containing protein [Loigolactobacillus zhaoyuanensis]|uniref:Endonuclease III domain-containing protein n=1 Tax=Loigolactobacillus zhaoyuanensis TaxID=2486017 RepID=A0ABW8U9Q9_9LACO|nr:deoxyribonuclease I [Loigolactobacillus zhaoyuanensis]
MQLTIKQLYQTMYTEMGPQGWWPADSKWEIILGAILVQNTNWRNVVPALANLKASTNFEPAKLHALSATELEPLIRSSGFYHNKSKAISAVFTWLATYDYDLTAIKQACGDQLRPKLLTLRGIGAETADVFLVYIFDVPTFIADSYTRRLFTHLGVPSSNYQQLYRQVQLPPDFTPAQAQEFHGLLDEFGKLYLQTPAGWPQSFLAGAQLIIKSAYPAR